LGVEADASQPAGELVTNLMVCFLPGPPFHSQPPA